MSERIVYNGVCCRKTYNGVRPIGRIRAVMGRERKLFYFPVRQLVIQAPSEPLSLSASDIVKGQKVAERRVYNNESSIPPRL
jgi:hypothetical protein